MNYSIDLDSFFQHTLSNFSKVILLEMFKKQHRLAYPNLEFDQSLFQDVFDFQPVL